MKEKSMRKERKGGWPGKKKLIAGAVGLFAVAMLVFSIPALQASAIFDESTAVRFRVYKSSHTIENSVLFIGTHLIHIQGLTDELYEKAVDSQSDSQQTSIYYKSELADGLWYDITDASGLSYITSEGTPIDESELDDLYVCYYTGADGITKDARTGEAVCIFDTTDPYDLMQLEELEAMRRIYENSYLEEESGSQVYISQQLRAFFSQDMHTETTDRYDRMLENLQKLYEAYGAAGMDENAQVIQSLMDGIDAARRADVFERLTVKDDTTSYTDVGEMFNVASGSYYTDDVAEDYDDEPFSMDSTLTDGVSTSLSECTTSYSSYAAKMLANGGSKINTYKYNQCIALTEKCEAGEVSATDEDVLEIVNNIKYAQNIEKGVVGDADGELNLINNEFMPDLEDDFSVQLHKGVSQEYQAAAKENKSDAAKTSILEADKTEVETARNALETMITAKKERLSSSDALDYVYECITWSYDEKSQIKKDDFAAAATESAEAHIEWLTQLAGSIVNGDASLMSELDKLKDLLSDYLTKQQEALDDNNLTLAAQYGTLAEDTSNKIAAEEARLNEVLKSDTATEAEKAAARVALGDTGLLSDLNKLKSQAKSAIGAGNDSSWKSAISMLGTLGGEDTLKELKDTLENSNLSEKDKKSWTDELDDAIETSKESSLHDQASAAVSNADTSNADEAGGTDETGTDGTGSNGTGSNGTGSNGTGSDGSGNDGDSSGSTSSTTNPATLSEQVLLNAINEVFGASFDELDAKGRVAVAAGLDMLYDSYSNVNAKTLAGQYISRCASQGSPYVYTKLSGHAETEYLSLATLGNRKATSYRYVYSDSRQEATLTYGATSYSFRVGASVVELADGTQKSIDTYKVEFQNVPYIDEATAKTYFACEAEYIAGTDYSACLTKSIKEKAEELYKTLTNQ